MCLALEHLNMQYWPEYDTYYGTGYKAIKKGTLADKYFNTWLTATGTYGINRFYEDTAGNPQEIHRIYADQPNQNNRMVYPAGFHILLSHNHAYHYPSYSDIGKCDILKVKYTDIIGFGNQELLGQISTRSAPCVIARHMYIVK